MKLIDTNREKASERYWAEGMIGIMAKVEVLYHNACYEKDRGKIQPITRRGKYRSRVCPVCGKNCLAVGEGPRHVSWHLIDWFFDGITPEMFKRLREA